MQDVCLHAGNLQRNYNFPFSTTYSTVQDRANLIWKFQHYYLIADYQIRDPIPPPLSLLVMFYKFPDIFRFYRNNCTSKACKEGIPSKEYQQPGKSVLLILLCVKL